MNNLAEKNFNEIDRKFGIRNNKYTLYSVEVSEMINKKHKFLLRNIRRYMKQFNEINSKRTHVQIALIDFSYNFFIYRYKK